MGFLSRKKPKPAPVDIHEERPMEDELQGMEEAVPERPVDEAPQSAGPVSDTSSSPTGEDPASSPPTGEEFEVDEQPTTVFQAVAPEVEEVEAPELPDEELDEGDGRMKAVDLIAPTRLDFLAEKEADAERPVKTAEVFVFANQKGGVAKTTTTLNLAVAFAESGYRVLCIDLDPQGNLTMSQGIDPDKVEKRLYDVLVNDMPISEIIVKREIDIAVASIDLAGAEIAMSTKIGRERSLEKALKEVSGY